MDNQQGNGFIGGGIGLVGGGIAAGYLQNPMLRFIDQRSSEFEPEIKRMPTDEFIAQQVKDMPYEQYGDTVDMMGRPRKTTPSDERTKAKVRYENEVIDSVKAYGDWNRKHDKIKQAASLLLGVGLPITASLLGSTLTD